MIPLSVPDVASALGARTDGRPLCSRDLLPEVSIDSRTIRQGECFVAVKGERHDGHDFVGSALEKGARVIIQSRPAPPGDWGDRLFLRVRDTQQALQALGTMVRSRWTGPLLAISGSMGKTTTRQFTATLLAQRYRVFQSPRNLNNHLGVPLSLLALDTRHQLAVLELGMNHPGEISRLVRICRPDDGLLTNVAAVHLENFADLEEIAKAKGELLEGLPVRGRFFYNADDPRLLSMASGFGGEAVSFGLGAGARVRILDHRFESSGGMVFRIRAPAWELEAEVPFPGRHFLYNIAASVAVALGYGLTRDQVREGIGRLQTPGMRGNLRRLRGGGEKSITVWDDSYNSNPEALCSVLETLGQLPGYLRKVLALGDMLELGSSSARLHRECGVQAAGCGPDLLVTVGPRAREIGRGAGQEGLPEDRIAHFETADEAGEFLAARLRGGDLLLVKGSRGVGMDRLIRRVEERMAG